MIAEYVACAGEPRADTPWPLVLHVASRAPQFEARRHLTTLDAVSGAINASFSSEPGGGIADMRDRLDRLAYPVRGKRAERFMPNMFAGDE